MAGSVNTLSGFEMPRSGMMEVSMERQATVERKTKETDIFLRLDIDGNGKGEVHTFPDGQRESGW